MLLCHWPPEPAWPPCLTPPRPFLWWVELAVGTRRPTDSTKAQDSSIWVDVDAAATWFGAHRRRRPSPHADLDASLTVPSPPIHLAQGPSIDRTGGRFTRNHHAAAAAPAAGAAGARRRRHHHHHRGGGDARAARADPRRVRRAATRGAGRAVVHALPRRRCEADRVPGAQDAGPLRARPGIPGPDGGGHGDAVHGLRPRAPAAVDARGEHDGARCVIGRVVGFGVWGFRLD